MGRPATTTTSKTTAANTNGNAKRIVYRRPRKDSSEVSPLIKYLLFIFNVLFSHLNLIKHDEVIKK